jgi:hypothetical protein
MQRELRDAELHLALDHRLNLRSAISFWETGALFWETFNALASALTLTDE